MEDEIRAHCIAELNAIARKWRGRADTADARSAMRADVQRVRDAYYAVYGEQLVAIVRITRKDGEVTFI